MKKILLLLIVITAGLSITGCVSSTESRKLTNVDLDLMKANPNLPLAPF